MRLRTISVSVVTAVLLTALWSSFVNAGEDARPPRTAGAVRIDVGTCPTTVAQKTLRCMRDQIRLLASEVNAITDTHAIAYVAQDGTLFHSRNVNAVTHPQTGVWCFDLPFTPQVAIATVTGFAGFGNQIIHTSIPPGTTDACTGANPTDGAAFMRLPDGSPYDYQFFILFE